MSSPPPEGENAPEKKKPYTWNDAAKTMLFLMGLALVVDIAAITTLGKNANATFSKIGSDTPIPTSQPSPASKPSPTSK